ncbi:hypothetical protein RB595_004774 [Gaeumannomyces hyphopodioides]
MGCAFATNSDSIASHLNEGVIVQLNSFYNYKMWDGDLFEIAIRNYDGIEYCPHGAILDDTPYEFKIKDGSVVNAWEPSHRHRARGSAANIPRQERVGANLREYEDEYGDRVLSLSRNATSSLVGRTISNGQRGLTIMKEIVLGS